MEDEWRRQPRKFCSIVIISIVQHCSIFTLVPHPTRTCIDADNDEDRPPVTTLHYTIIPQLFWCFYIYIYICNQIDLTHPASTRHHLCANVRRGCLPCTPSPHRHHHSRRCSAAARPPAKRQRDWRIAHCVSDPLYSARAHQ